MNSLSTDQMMKTPKNNPFAAFMPDADTMQKNAEAWLKAMPMADSVRVNGLTSHPMAAAAATSAIGFGVASQMWGAWFGAMTGAMQAAEKMQGAARTSDIKPFAGMADLYAFDWGFEGAAADGAKPEAKKQSGTAAKKASEKAAAIADAVPQDASQIIEQVAAETARVAEDIVEGINAAAATVEAAFEESRAAFESAVPVKEPKPVQKTKKAKKSKKTSKAEPVAVAAAPLEQTVAAAPVAADAPAATAEETAFKRPEKANRPEQPDDLKMIAGVGPKLEQVLNSLGVWTYAQIAAWTPQEVAWVDDFLQFSGRIERDEWIKQADALARGGRDEYVKIFGKEPR